MSDNIDADVKKEAIKSLLQPFSERFSHPILAWILIFSTYFHIRKIAKFILYLNDQYTPPGNLSILDDIGKELTFCNIIAPFFWGAAVGFAFPVFDAGYSKWVAFVQRIRENWVRDELSQIYKKNIEFLNITLELVLGLIENSQHRDVLYDLDSGSGVTNYLKVVRCINTLEVGDYTKFEPGDGIAYPCSSYLDKPFGIVIKKFNSSLALVLQVGRIKNSRMKDRFPIEGFYTLSEGKYSSVSEEGYSILKREGDWIILKSTQSQIGQLDDSIGNRFRNVK